MEGSKEEIESQRSDEESHGEEEEEEDDDDDAVDEQYPEQDNVVVGTFTPNETEIETLPNDDEIVDVGTYDDEVQVVRVKCAKEVGASKPSPVDHRKWSPSSSQKPSVKRTNHKRSP